MTRTRKTLFVAAVIVLTVAMLFTLSACGKEKRYDPAPEQGDDNTVLPPGEGMADVDMPANSPSVDTTEPPVEAAPTDVPTETDAGADETDAPVDTDEIVDTTETPSEETAGTDETGKNT